MSSAKLQRAGQEAIKQFSRKPPTTPQVILDSLLAKTAYTRKRSAKKFKEKTHKDLLDEVKNDRLRLARSKLVKGITFKTAREQRHEDWELGPLAPKRDVGLDAGNEYATVSAAFIEPPDMENLRTLRRKQGSDAWKDGNRKYEPHDRVVVIKGREAGRIGIVKKVKETAGLIHITGINTVSLFPSCKLLG
jgi:large subunit ribosomal protein L24